ncbi:MAG: VTT domain-containing protein [Acidimicrobiales bacterium]
MPAAESPVHVPSGPPSPAIRNAVVAMLVVCVIAAWTGDLLLSVLIPDHPLIFIILNSRNRNLVLASPLLDPWSFYCVTFVRLLVSDPLFFLLGRWYGDAGVRWMERRTPTFGGMIRTLEGWFGKASYPLVALAPNNFICLFAGSAGMSVTAFFAVNMIGTAVRLVILRSVGDIFSSPLGDVQGFIADHRLVVFAISAALLAFTIWSERRAGGSEVEQLLHLDDEIAGAGARPDGEAPADPADGPAPS